jgi:hypothetical protein
MSGSVPPPLSKTASIAFPGSGANASELLWWIMLLSTTDTRENRWSRNLRCQD